MAELRGESTAGTVTLEWNRWGFAAAVASASVVACFFATFWLPSLLGLHQWLPMGDAPTTVQSAQFVANGGLPWVYQANAGFLPLPGFLLLLAPAVAIGNHFGLLNDLPYQIPHPTMWVAVTPVFFLTGASAVLGVDYLADSLAMRISRRRVVAAAVAFVVVVPTCCWTGHSEDLLCLGLSAASLGLVLRHRHGPAALSLTLAILMQPWALLLIPILVVTAPWGRRLRTLVQICALPGVTAVVLLAMDFKDAYRSLVIQPMPSSHGQRLPWWSLTHQTKIMTDAGAMVVRVGSLPRTVAVLVAVLAAIALRRHPSPQRIVAVAAVALVSRGLFETQLWPYYLAPGAVLLLVGAAAFAEPRSWRWPAGALAALVFYGAVAGAYAGETFQAPLALLVLVISAVAGLWSGRDRLHTGAAVPPVALTKSAT